MEAVPSWWRWKIFCGLKCVYVLGRWGDCLAEAPNCTVFRHRAAHVMTVAGCVAIRSGGNCDMLGNTPEEIPLGYFKLMSLPWKCFYRLNSAFRLPSVPRLWDLLNMATIAIGTSTLQCYLCHSLKQRMTRWMWRVWICVFSISLSATIGKSVHILPYMHIYVYTHIHTSHSSMKQSSFVLLMCVVLIVACANISETLKLLRVDEKWSYTPVDS